MVGGKESARSVTHLAELFVLADAARLLDDPELARPRRPRRARARRGRAAMSTARMSFNQMTVDQLSLAEARRCARTPASR